MSDYVLNVLRIAGVPVDDFDLSERESYSHNTRKRAYQERLGSIYANWNQKHRHQVSENIAKQLSRKEGSARRLQDALAGVGWTIADGKLLSLEGL